MTTIERIARDYVVTAMPDNITYSVWHEGMEEPYTTRLVKPRSCNCLDWWWRKRQSHGKCKHHEIVEFKLANNAVL